jgi:hypothetical protein
MAIQKRDCQSGSCSDRYANNQLRVAQSQGGAVTYAHSMGRSDRAMAKQTNHAKLESVAHCVRISDAWTNNAAVEISL